MTLATRKPLKSVSGKPKKCRMCPVQFVPSKPLQFVCGTACALLHATRQRERERKALDKIERKVIRTAKEKIKRKSEHEKDTERAVNAYIRERDRDLPCISCGTTADVQYAAGHYRTVGACPELRFEPLNIHKQCNRNCNMGKSGNIVEYRINLVKKIGAEQVAWLEGPHKPKRYSIDDLKQIKAQYRAMTRELKRAGGN